MTAARSFLYRHGRLHEADGPALLPTERGFTLGDGVFETLRTVDSRPLLLPAHLARLRRSAAAIDLAVPLSDAELSRAAGTVQDLAALPGETVMRLTLSRGPARARGLLPGDAGPPTVLLQVMPLSPPAPGSQRLRIVVSTIRRNEGSPLAQIKSLNYLDNVLARREAAVAGADDALMLNNRDEVACVSAGNIFWTEPLGRDGQVCLVTPPCSCGVLAGITREVVLALAHDAGMPCRQKAVGLAEMLSCAQEAFVTNSVLGVQPIAALAGTLLSTEGPDSPARRLAAAYAAFLRDAATP
ncbi:MAG: aminotransferase class IV [Chloroflexota bacterium]